MPNMVVMGGIPHPAVEEPGSVVGWQAVVSGVPGWGAAFSYRHSRGVVVAVVVLQAVRIIPCLPQPEQELWNC